MYPPSSLYPIIEESFLYEKLLSNLEPPPPPPQSSEQSLNVIHDPTQSTPHPSLNNVLNLSS